MKVWQLKNLQTNELLNEAQPLPENWGPIFGLSGFLDRLGDLSWLGSEYSNLGWVEVGEIEDTPEKSKSDQINDTIQHLLDSSSDKVALDNLSITKAERAQWFEYRRLLREIPLQPDFPENIYWPARPE